MHMPKSLEELNRHRKSLGLQPIDPNWKESKMGAANFFAG
jgi:hypothetical protein